MLPSYPHRLIEENLWRAIRHGMSGDLIDLGTGRVRPARAALEELLEWVAPMAEELGAAPYLVLPATSPAQRQIARYDAGQSLGEIYAQEVLEAVRV
jgi:carboxylate-amine ligase